MSMSSERTNDDLSDILADLWYRHFPDVPQPNDVTIKFGQKAATRLGSIKWGRKATKQADGSLQRRSIITITGHFKDSIIPDEVVRAVIGHELVHYAHGFSSPNPKLHAHPHHGGIVDKELKTRGLGDILKTEKCWLKDHWPMYLKNHHTSRRRRIRLF